MYPLYALIGDFLLCNVILLLAFCKHINIIVYLYNKVLLKVKVLLVLFAQLVWEWESDGDCGDIKVHSNYPSQQDFN